VEEFRPFGFLTDQSALPESERFTQVEQIALFVVLGISVLGLLYAAFLVRQVIAADKGTAKMQEVAAAIRDGAQAYLKRQRNALLPLIVIITIILVVAAFLTHAQATTPRMPGASTAIPADAYHIAFGRGIAFLMGSIFSMLVGTVGMAMATRGNLAVAAAAPTGFGKALQLG
jgi:K(+)-stimulated pyrophosphate-energized sodium pump